MKASVDEGTKYFIPIVLIIGLNRFYLFKKLSRFLTDGGESVRVYFAISKMKWLLEHVNDGNVSNQEIRRFYGIVAPGANANPNAFVSF